MRRATLIVLSLALTVAAVPAADATIHIVNQTQLSFVPAELTIDEGDTVRWVWSSLSHTVTNGTGSDDPAAGVLFDATLDSADPTFQYVFTTPGVYPYFCRPHESVGMDGVITVNDSTPVEAATWSRIKQIFEHTDR